MGNRMSNLSQFFNANIPLGATAQLAYQSDLYTDAGGSEWLMNTPTAAFDYTNEYSNLPDIMTSCHPIFDGPEPDGSWWPSLAPVFNIAYDPVNNVHCTSAYSGNALGDGFTYYYKIGTGPWTAAIFPNNILYNYIVYVGGKFIAVANATTNAVITSTDAISWTSSNLSESVSASGTGAILSDGGSNIVIFGSSTQSTQWSSDGGATWTKVTLPSLPGAAAVTSGRGFATYNAGAGLFMMSTSTPGRYQTSPTGQTWTTYSNQPSYRKFKNYLAEQVRFVSNATTTIAIGTSGFCIQTTDGLNWTDPSRVAESSVGPLTSTGTEPVNSFYYDGTRFVVRYGMVLFYSTDGKIWTRSKPIGGHTLNLPCDGGVLFAFPLLSSNIRTKCLRISDVTSTARQTVLSNILAVNLSTAALGVAYRIK
jgi:hypothetical protein